MRRHRVGNIRRRQPESPQPATIGLDVPVRLLIDASELRGLESLWFLEGGRLGYETVRAYVPGRPDSVLDFGCGCGRVTRYWLGAGVKVAGSDLDRRRS